MLQHGLALVELYRDRLAEPGRAMEELRRLIDRYPGERATARLRAMLAEPWVGFAAVVPPRDDDSLGLPYSLLLTPLTAHCSLLTAHSSLLTPYCSLQSGGAE